MLLYRPMSNIKRLNQTAQGLGVSNMKTKSFIFTFCIILSLCLSKNSHAQTTIELRKNVERIVEKFGFAKGEVGFYATISEGDHQETILEVESHRKLIPASISKLATASTVLDVFPAGSKFKTTLLSDAKIEGSVLKGNLYLRGGGDPSFVSENMWFLVNAFLRTGIRKIEGDIIVDDSLFDSLRFDPSRQAERVDRAYDAPVGAMSFNWNSINIFVRPGKTNEPAQVFLDPENDYVELVNKTKTIGSGQALFADRIDDKKNQADVIHVGGKIGHDIKEFVIYKNITKPDLWSGENLKSFLKQRSVVVTGKVRNAVTPEKAEILAESDSKGVEQILSDMNKFSNNYVAEMLCKNIASTKVKPATIAAGMAMVNQHLKAIGVPENEVEFENPSGLTRNNRITAYGMWKILLHLKNDFRVQPELLTSLPIAGIDGTLKKRMKEGPAERWVRAKTGLLNGVVALAGYGGRRDGRVVSFVFMYNGKQDEAKIRNHFDQIVTEMVK